MEKVSAKFKDITGQFYGRWLVLKFHEWKIKPKSNTRYAVFWCKCNCGNEKAITGSSLVSGTSKSCGCIAKESGFKISLHRGHPEGGFNDLWNVYKRGAKKRNLCFKLTKEKFKELTSLNCHYCGKIPSFVRKSQSKYNSLSKDYIYNGIDRIDSSKGYFEGNVLTCCHSCNMMKRDTPYEEFIKNIKTICVNLKLH